MTDATSSWNYKCLLWAMLAGIIVAAYSLAPQIGLWSAKGDAWNGIYAVHDFDELAYAAYIQSLIDGKPRINSPYTGSKNEVETPQKESLFSVQFLAFYPIAILARPFGASSSAAMIMTSAVIGFLAGLALFWLFKPFFASPFLCFVGTVVVFSSGAILGGQGSMIAGYSPSSIFYFTAFPFARRAVPAIGFPALFLFFVSVWKVLTGQLKRTQFTWGAIASLSFLVLVFSYFYLWTVAAAWFGVWVTLWLMFGPNERKRTILPILVLGLVILAVLVPYFIMLADRADTIDAVQLLVLTHQPDLWRLPEIVGLVAIVGLVVARALRLIDWAEPKFAFFLTFPLVAVVVFNQQVLTGRSLQPIHYQFFVVNYLVAFTVTALAFIFLNKRVTGRHHSAVLVFLLVCALYVGYSDAQFAFEAIGPTNAARDALVPVAQKIKTIARDSGKTTTVLSLDLAPLKDGEIRINNSDELPALASQAVLWAPHQKVFSDLTTDQNDDRLFKFLYYHNFDAARLTTELRNGKAELINGFFGWGRNSEVLTGQSNKVSDEEIIDIVKRYEHLRENFSHNDARTPMLSYLIIHEAATPDLSAVDKWYERDSGEKVGRYTLFRLNLRGLAAQ